MKSETMERCLAGEAAVSRADRLTYLLLTTLYLVIVILLLSTRKSAASLLTGPTGCLAHHGLASEATLHEASPTLSLICVYLRPSAVKAFIRVPSPPVRRSIGSATQLAARLAKSDSFAVILLPQF